MQVHIFHQGFLYTAIPGVAGRDWGLTFAIPGVAGLTFVSPGWFPVALRRDRQHCRVTSNCRDRLFVRGWIVTKGTTLTCQDVR